MCLPLDSITLRGSVRHGSPLDLQPDGSPLPPLPGLKVYQVRQVDQGRTGPERMVDLVPDHVHAGAAVAYDIQVSPGQLVKDKPSTLAASRPDAGGIISHNGNRNRLAGLILRNQVGRSRHVAVGILHFGISVRGERVGRNKDNKGFLRAGVPGGQDLKIRVLRHVAGERRKGLAPLLGQFHQVRHMRADGQARLFPGTENLYQTLVLKPPNPRPQSAGCLLDSKLACQSRLDRRSSREPGLAKEQ